MRSCLAGKWLMVEFFKEVGFRGIGLVLGRWGGVGNEGFGGFVGEGEGSL